MKTASFVVTAAVLFQVTGGLAVKVHAAPTTSGETASELPAALNGALSCSTSVAFFGNYATGFTSDDVLSANGHAVSTVTGAGILGGALAGIDVLYMDRNAGPSAPVLAAIKAFVEAGGTLITEFGATPIAMPTLGFATGNLISGFFVPSGNVGGGNTATVVAPANALASALPPTWTTGDPIGVFQVLASIDPALEVVAEVQGTSNGDLPIVATGCLGSGAVVFFLTDFGDFNPPSPEDVTLLLNAACFGEFKSCTARAPVPVLSPWGLAAVVLLLASMGAWFIRRSA